MAGSVGAGNRLFAASQEAKTRAAARLAPKLAKANTQTYLRQMRAHAKAFGASKPKAITDKAVLAQIAARARVSAESIVNTQADRMASLIAATGSIHDAQQPFKQWEAQQLEKIVAFESSTTRHAALTDLIARNGLEGTERLMPDTAAVDDECQDAIDQGDVPIGTLGTPPYHLNCPHFLETTFLPPDDPSTLDFGG